MLKAFSSSHVILNRSGVALDRTQPVLDLFETLGASDDEIESALPGVRRSEAERKPSTKALFQRATAIGI